MYELYFSDEHGNKTSDELSTSITGSGSTYIIGDEYVCVKFKQPCLVIREYSENNEWKTSFDYASYSYATSSGYSTVKMARLYMSPGSTYTVKISYYTPSYANAPLEFVRILDDNSQSS